MTNEEILDRLRDLVEHLPKDLEPDAPYWLDELSDRLSGREVRVTVSFNLVGSPESIGVSLGEMLRLAAPEQLEELRSQLRQRT